MKKYSYLILIFSIIITGCKKKQLKTPTDVSFQMDINRSPSNSGHLVFNSGSILLANFNVEGERQEGGPISFNKSFSQGLSINLNSTSIPDLVFDIPQGNYYSLSVSFLTFDDNGDITIQVDGTYTNQLGSSFPLRLEFLSGEYFSVVGEDESGEATIVLKKDVSATSLIKFDPIYWFGLISYGMFDNATLVNIGGQQTILINESVNSNIYDLVVDRIDHTTESLW